MIGKEGSANTDGNYDFKSDKHYATNYSLTGLSPPVVPNECWCVKKSYPSYLHSKQPSTKYCPLRSPFSNDLALTTSHYGVSTFYTTFNGDNPSAI